MMILHDFVDDSTCFFYRSVSFEVDVSRIESPCHVVVDVEVFRRLFCTCRMFYCAVLFIEKGSVLVRVECRCVDGRYVWRKSSS